MHVMSGITEHVLESQKRMQKRLSSFSVMLAKVPYIKLFSVQCKKNISPKNFYTIMLCLKKRIQTLRPNSNNQKKKPVKVIRKLMKLMKNRIRYFTSVS